MELKIIAPAAPGGGWDQTARSMQQALIAEKLVKSAQVINVAGAGGTVGLAQFVNGAKGDGNQLMVNGFVMVGAHPDEQVAGLAVADHADRAAHRGNAGHGGAGEFADQDRQGSRRSGEEGRRQGDVRRRLGRRRRPHHGGAVRRRGRRRRRRRSTTSPFSGGGESLAAILGGKVTAGISGYGEYEGQIKAGKLRAIGVTSPQRLPGVDVPTFKEQGVDLVLTNWRSVFGAPGINDAQKKALGDARREAGEVGGLEGNPQAEGLGRRLSAGRRRSRSSSTDEQIARQQRAEDGRPGEVVAQHRVTRTPRSVSGGSLENECTSCSLGRRTWTSAATARHRRHGHRRRAAADRAA